MAENKWVSLEVLFSPYKWELFHPYNDGNVHRFTEYLTVWHDKALKMKLVSSHVDCFFLPFKFQNSTIHGWKPHENHMKI